MNQPKEVEIKAHELGAFWLTGSQVFKLMRGVQEPLAGRVAVLSLTSLSQAEISGGEMEPFIIELDALNERKKGREEADAIDSLKFFRFITAVAARCGQMVNVAEIARDADINQTQAKNG